jgi:hypothetical protein
MKRLLLVPLIILLSSVAAEDLPAPMDFGTKDVSVCIAVPKLQAFLDNAETFLKPFVGDAMQPGALKAGLGTALNDAGLVGLDLDKPVVWALFKAEPVETPPVPPPPAALFVPAKSADVFAAALQKAGLRSAFDDGLLMVSRTEEGILKAREQKALYARIIAANIKGDARVYLNVSSLFETYTPVLRNQLTTWLPMIGMGMAMGKPDADPAAIQKMLKLELKTGKALLSQLEIIQHDIWLKQDTLEIASVYAAKDGTPLAELLTAPPAGKIKALNLISNTKGAVAAMRFDGAKFKSAANHFIDDLKKDPAMAEVLDEQATAMLKQFAGCFGGEFVTTIAPLPEGGFDQDTALAVTDEKAYMDLMEKVRDLLQPDQPLGKMYSTMGMKMKTTFEKNVREHAGVSVSRMKMELDTAALPPDQAAAIKALEKGSDFAISHGMFLSGNRAEELDAMLDKLFSITPPKAPQLQAMKIYGEDKQIYLDTDWAGMFKSVLALYPNNPAALFLGRMKSTDPVALAGSFDKGRLYLQATVPMAPFNDFAAAIRPLMLMRGQRQKPVAPPKPPDKKDQDAF